MLNRTPRQQAQARQQARAQKRREKRQKEALLRVQQSLAARRPGVARQDAAPQP